MMWCLSSGYDEAHSHLPFTIDVLETVMRLEQQIHMWTKFRCKSQNYLEW